MGRSGRVSQNLFKYGILATCLFTRLDRVKPGPSRVSDSLTVEISPFLILSAS